MIGKKNIAIVVFAISTLMLNAQVPQPEYDEALPKAEVIAKSFGDSVIIRWAPDSPELWQLGNKYGYIIERKVVVRDGKVVKGDTEAQLVSTSPVKPMPLESIRPLADKDDYAGVVAQAIYGETFQLKTQEENDMVSFFNRATDLENRFSFALFSADVSFNAARAHGLAYTDKNIHKNEKYVYRVYPAFDYDKMPYDTGFTFIDAGEIYEVPSPIDVWAVFGDRMAEISWDKKLQESVFTSYLVERSDDNGKTFRQINQNPVINLANIPDKQIDRNFYIDSIPENNINYYYRIRGITPFGEISPPSDTAGGRGVKATPFIHPMITGYKLLEQGVKIEWEVMEKYGYEIHGFKVKRAGKADGVFVDITGEKIEASEREYVDNHPNTVNYYEVCALNEEGEEFCSFPSLIQLPDSIPPLPPVNLLGKVDSAGIVWLTWEANTEPDFQSYRVYRGNQPEGEFVKINTDAVLTNAFTDTVNLNSLDEEVYYRFTAVDIRYNESDFSDVLMVKKPDVVPPVSPVIKSAKCYGNYIGIMWLPVPGRDVEKYLLYRKEPAEEQWKLMTVKEAADTTYAYHDEEIQELKQYDYLLIAVDDDGLESEPTVPVRVSAGLFEYPPVEKITIHANRQDRSIRLAWKYKQEGVTRYYIYKSVNDSPFALCAVLNGNIPEYHDTNVKPGNTYGYKVQAEFGSGNRSVLSEPVNVKF